MKQFLVFVLFLLMAGCATNNVEQEAMQSISVGMSRQDVLARLGTPDDVWLGDEIVVMRYDIHTPDTGKTLQCMGAGFNGQYLPGCSGESYNVPYFININIWNDKVVAFGRLQSQPGTKAPAYSSPTNVPRAPMNDIDPLSPEPASPEPSFENFACKDAMRRYKVGAISFKQMEYACQ